MPLPCQSAITKQKNDARAFQQNGVAEVDAHRAAFVLDLAWSPRAASSGKNTQTSSVSNRRPRKIRHLQAALVQSAPASPETRNSATVEHLTAHPKVRFKVFFLQIAPAKLMQFDI